MRRFFLFLLAIVLWSPAVVPAQEAQPPAEAQPATEDNAENAVNLDDLIAAVGGADEAAALDAIREIANRGAAAAKATPALVALLAHQNAELRQEAAESLGAIGEAAKEAVPQLTDALADEVPAVRAYAAFALGRIGKPAESAAVKLVDLAFDQDELVRRAAIRAIRTIDPPDEITEPLVMKILEEGDPAVVLPALHSLAQDGAAGVPKLREKLKHEKAAYWVCIVLGEIGPEAKDAVPDLAAVLSSEDPLVRLQALLALGHIGSASQSAVPEIIKVLQNDAFDDVRNAAAFALGKIGHKSDEVNAALVAAAKSGKPFLRMISVWAIAKINPGHVKAVRYAVDVMIDGLKSEDPHLRNGAAQALSEFGDHPLIVGPALVEALNDTDPAVVANAVAALAAVGEKLLDRLESRLEDKELRMLALRVINRMGPRAAPAVPALLKALETPPENDEDKIFLREVVMTLAMLGPAAKDATPRLIQLLGSEIEEVQHAAAFVLGKIGPDAKDAIEPLQQLLDKQDTETAVVFAWALLKIHPEDQAIQQKAIPLLIASLDAKFDLSRAEAAAALGELGPAATDAVEPLKKLSTDDPVQWVRAAATEALKKIEGE